MKRELSHEEAFVTLSAAALDALDASDRDAVFAHVAECGECRAELETLRGTAANLAFAAPLAANSHLGSRTRTRDRLSARATAESQARRLANPPLVFPKIVDEPTPTRTRPLQIIPTPAPRRSVAEWMALLAGVLFVVTLGMLAVTWRDRELLRTSLDIESSRASASRRAIDSLTALVLERDSLLSGLTTRDVGVMTLTSRASKDLYARMFWDRAHNTLTLVAHNMPALKSGRTYQLWIVTAKATVSAGTFDSSNGIGTLRTTYTVPSDNFRAAAITEEPAGGVAQPTGETIISVTAAR